MESYIFIPSRNGLGGGEHKPSKAKGPSTKKKQKIARFFYSEQKSKGKKRNRKKEGSGSGEGAIGSLKQGVCFVRGTTLIVKGL